MIERKFVMENKKEYLVEEFVKKELKGVGHSKTQTKKTPLGEKIIIHASRPGLVVGRGGSNIKKLTKLLKNKFKLENPQIEIAEVENMNLDSNIVAERIVTSLERFGPKRFKGIMHKAMADVMRAGAMGVEILLSGTIPGSRARTWRVYSGYLKKCGDVASTGVKIAKMQALLKQGTAGVIVKIMPPDVELPDKITLKEHVESEVEEIIEPVQKELKSKKSVKKTPGKKIVKKKTAKKVTKKKEILVKEDLVKEGSVKEDLTKKIDEKIEEVKQNE